MFVSHLIHPKLLASSILWYSSKITPTQLFKIYSGNFIKKLNFVLNLHLICDSQYWVFAMEG